MPDTGRLYTCARCRAQVVVCRACDRGQIYCFDGCAPLARGERQREAARRYQASRRGRFAHAERSRRYRLHRAAAPNVTHQGSAACRAGDLLHIEVTVRLIDTIAAAVTRKAMLPASTGPLPCQRCGAHCPGGLRLGFVRHHRRPLPGTFDDHCP